jgi:hypothetical protein
MAATTTPADDPICVIRGLTLTRVEQRLADLDGERAALSLLRRSLAARDRALRRKQKSGRDTAPDDGQQGGAAGV